MLRSLMAIALCAASMIAGCFSFATGHTYGPRTSFLGAPGQGYESSKLDENTWQVTYTMNRKEEADRYLLYRSAEVTVENGYDYFVIVNQSGNQAPGTATAQSPSYSDLDYDPGDYTASARIRLFKGTKPADDLNALDAHEVLKNLEPQIKR